MDTPDMLPVDPEPTPTVTEETIEATETRQEQEFESQVVSMRKSCEWSRNNKPKEAEDLDMAQFRKDLIIKTLNQLAALGWSQGALKLEKQGLLVEFLKSLSNLSDAGMNFVLTNMNLLTLFHHFVEPFKTQALTTLCSTLLDRLTLESKVSLMYLLSFLYGKKMPLEMMRYIVLFFTSTKGLALTELKNKIDYHGRHHHTHKIVFRYITDESLRARILAHFAEQASTLVFEFQHSDRSHWPVKILSDIDDTVICSGGNVAGQDRRYAWGTRYPGVSAFYRELDTGSKRTSFLPETSNIVFISARPEMVEHKTYEKFQNTDMHTPCIVLTGSLRDGIKTAWGNYDPTVNSKVWNYLTISQIYPEYKFVFFGDNGQADYVVGKKIVEANPNSVLEVFIHQVYPIEGMVGYQAEEWKALPPNFHFFKTYIGAAIDGFLAGLVSLEGLGRVIEEAKTDFDKIEKDLMSQTIGGSGWGLSSRASKATAQIESLLERRSELNVDIARAAEYFPANAPSIIQ